MDQSQEVLNATEGWLQRVVIGLNLCPFARRPAESGQVRIEVSAAQDEEGLLEDLFVELQRLEQASPSDLETTLVVVPNFLTDFMDYNQFLDWVDNLLVQQDWEGVFQVATFHPQYCFAGTAEDDPENLTNRSPYPIFHLIREDSLAKAIEHYPNPEAIPDNNIVKMNSLSQLEKQRLFPYLFGG